MLYPFGLSIFQHRSTRLKGVEQNVESNLKIDSKTQQNRHRRGIHSIENRKFSVILRFVESV